MGSRAAGVSSRRRAGPRPSRAAARPTPRSGCKRSQQLLGQLLGNLLDNACKYSPPGTPVTVEVGRDGLERDAGGAGPRHGHRRRRLAAHFRALLSLVEIAQAARRGTWAWLSSSESPRSSAERCMRKARPGAEARFTVRLPDATPSIVLPDRLKSDEIAAAARVSLADSISPQL